MTLLSGAYGRSLGVQVVVSGARGPSDYQQWLRMNNPGTYNDYLNAMAQRVIGYAPGFKGNKGDPGGNVSDVGTFAQAKTLNLATTQPGTTTIRLSDRGKAVFERDTAAYGDLLVKFPTSENTWWWRDAGGTRWILAGDAISIEACGAVADKAADNTSIIQRALDFGTVSRRIVTVPAGTWGHRDAVYIRSHTGLHGVPGRSILWCPVRADAANYQGVGAIVLEGNRPSLYGITRVHYMPRPISINDRTPSDTGNGIYVKGANNFLVSHCRTEGPQGASIMLRGCQYGRVIDNYFDASLADCIHVTAAGVGDVYIYADDGTSSLNTIPIPAYRLHIGNNVVNNVGDDCIAVVSYVNHEKTEPTSTPVTTVPGYFTEYKEANNIRTYLAICQSVNITGNSTYGGDARGITVVGGKNVNISGNYVEDPVAAGVAAYGEDGYNTYGVDNVNITGNTFVKTGNGGDYKPLRYDPYGNQMKDKNGNLGLTRNPDGRTNPSALLGGRSAAMPGNCVAVRDNQFIGMRQRGIGIGIYSVNFDVQNNTFRDAIGVACFADAGTNVRIDGNRFYNCRDSAIGVNIFNMAGAVSVCNNHLDTINTGGSGGTDAIHFEGQPAAGVTNVYICGNTATGPQAYERLVEAFFNNVIAENNTGAGDVGLGNPPYSVKQRLKGAAVAYNAGDVGGSLNNLLTVLRNAGLINS